MTTRRRFLQISLAATTGLAAILDGASPPAVHAQTREIHFSTENYSEFISASECFNAPVYKSMEDHPTWKTDPKYEPIKESGQYGHLYGWPAPGEDKSQQVTSSFVIPNMFAKAVTGASTKDAIAWAEGEIKRIYGS